MFIVRIWKRQKKKRKFFWLSEKCSCCVLANFHDHYIVCIVYYSAKPEHRKHIHTKSIFTHSFSKQFSLAYCTYIWNTTNLVDVECRRMRYTTSKHTICNTIITYGLCALTEILLSSMYLLLFFFCACVCAFVCASLIQLPPMNKLIRRYEYGKL